jgi:hypothetical protein
LNQRERESEKEKESVEPTRSFDDEIERYFCVLVISSLQVIRRKEKKGKEKKRKEKPPSLSLAMDEWEKIESQPARETRLDQNRCQPRVPFILLHLVSFF